MTETVVHVTTLEQWKSVLDVWFKQGYRWLYNSNDYHYEIFQASDARYLIFDDEEITCFSGKFRDSQVPVIEYTDFMSKQKEDNKMETYYVTKEQLDLIESAKNLNYPLTGITAPENLQKEFDKTSFDNQKEVLRYLGGDPAIEFKVKEPLYRLVRIDDDGDSVYMMFGIAGTPTYTNFVGKAFTATLEKIREWQTPAWSVEEVN